MPCYLFTCHAYRSWMPDRVEGFVQRGKGILPPDDDLARQYRERAREGEILFDSDLQLLLIAESRIACEKQRYRGHFIATEPTHIHVLASWADDRSWLKVRSALKASLTRRLNREQGRRQWFVDNASRRHVKHQEHFDYLVNSYLPSHGGWKWKEGGEPFR